MIRPSCCWLVFIDAPRHGLLGLLLRAPSTQALVNHHAGAVLRADVNGKVQIKALLSDMPELRLGLNDTAEDATFHQ